ARNPVIITANRHRVQEQLYPNRCRLRPLGDKVARGDPRPPWPLTAGHIGHGKQGHPVIVETQVDTLGLRSRLPKKVKAILGPPRDSSAELLKFWVQINRGESFTRLSPFSPPHIDNDAPIVKRIG